MPIASADSYPFRRLAPEFQLRPSPGPATSPRLVIDAWPSVTREVVALLSSGAACQSIEMLWNETTGRQLVERLGGDDPTPDDAEEPRWPRTGGVFLAPDYCAGDSSPSCAIRS